MLFAKASLRLVKPCKITHLVSFQGKQHYAVCKKQERNKLKIQIRDKGSSTKISLFHLLYLHTLLCSHFSSMSTASYITFFFKLLFLRISRVLLKYKFLVFSPPLHYFMYFTVWVSFVFLVWPTSNISPSFFPNLHSFITQSF